MKWALALVVAGVLAATLSACGGGGGGGDGPITSPPTTRYGGMSYALGQNCSFAAANITTLAASAANADARRGCLNLVAGLGGGSSCNHRTFDDCAAVAVGQNSAGSCNIRGHVRSTLSAARAATLQECRERLGSTADCRVLAAACASGGPDSGTWKPSGSGGGGNNGDDSSGRYYGAFSYGLRGDRCSAGYAAGLATGYSSRDAARTAAINQCRSAGGRDCEGYGTFGSAYVDGQRCGALAQGETSAGRCWSNSHSGTSIASAESAALRECRSRGYSCRIIRSACSTSGPASAVNFTYGGDTGGGDTGGGGGSSGKYYGVIDFSYRGSGCSGGYAVGVATGYSSPSGAASAATRECSNAGGRNCGGVYQLKFGSAYSGNNDCGAFAHGETNRASDGSYRCGGRWGNGSTRAVAESAALSDCRNSGFNCSIVTSACSTSGTENSFSRTGSGDTGGGNTGGGTGGNRRPVAVGGFQDGSVQQGGKLTYSNISSQFSDPDGDRLRITASSNATRFATVRVSGDQMIVTGVQAFTSGAVTITVTATDPGGLFARTEFSVQVTAAPRQWGYYAIYPSKCTGNTRRGFVYHSGYSDQASASNALSSACNSRGGCPTGDTFRNSCVGVAVSSGCGYNVRWASSAASAQNSALAACRSRGGTNCASGARCAGNP